MSIYTISKNLINVTKTIRICDGKKFPPSCLWSMLKLVITAGDGEDLYILVKPPT